MQQYMYLTVDNDIMKVTVYYLVYFLYSVLSGALL